MTGPRRTDVPWRTAPTDRPFPEMGSDGTAAFGGPDALRAPELATDATAAGSWADGALANHGDVPAADPGGAGRSASANAMSSGSLPAPRSGDDALADPSPLPSLPPLPAGDDPAARAAVERWMDSDRAAHDDQPDPQPYRVLPTPPPPRPSLIDRSPVRPAPARDDLDEEYEDPQLRAWREEREFEAQFGQWRAGARSATPMRRATLVSPPVLLLAFVLLVILCYALTT